MDPSKAAAQKVDTTISVLQQNLLYCHEIYCIFYLMVSKCACAEAAGVDPDRGCDEGKTKKEIRRKNEKCAQSGLKNNCNYVTSHFLA